MIRATKNGCALDVIFKGKKVYHDWKKGDTHKTYSNINLAKKDLGYYPTTEYKSGIKKFINWYKKFYKI